jgi:hypothetical protein
MAMIGLLSSAQISERGLARRLESDPAALVVIKPTYEAVQYAPRVAQMARVGERDVLCGDSVDRDARVEAVGPIESEHASVVAIVCVFGDADRGHIVRDLANLVAEGQVDRGHTHLRGFEGIDFHTAFIEFTQDHIASQYAHCDS